MLPWTAADTSRVVMPGVASDHASLAAGELDQDRRNSRAIYKNAARAARKQPIRRFAGPAQSPVGDKLRQCLTNYLRLLED